MKKKILLAAVALAFQCSLFAQTDPVLMEIGNEKVTRSQFMHEFDVSVGSRMAKDATKAERRKALDEYIDLYATFRSKMLDAQSMGLDTVKSLRDELAKYRSELAAPYLIDSTVLDYLLREAYGRNHYSLHAAHILVRCSPDAMPDDTLAAYNRAALLRSRIVSGEDFFAVATEEEQRRNPGAQARPNEGDLGYFSVFDMVDPFESAAYALRPGEVSQPVRTRFGYHIIKLLDRVPLHGRVDMAHIWIGNRDTLVGHDRINLLYGKLQAGVPFEEVARSSDDRTTRDNGGLMADASLSSLPQEYVDKISTMRMGEESQPFHTQYGWHIVKLIRKDTLASFDEMKDYYKQRMTRDQRGDASRKAFATSCRKKYGVVDYTVVPADRKGRTFMASTAELEAQLPDSVFGGRWKGTMPSLTDLRPLVAVPGRTYNAVDLATYIQKHQKLQDFVDKKLYVRRHLDAFIDSVVVVYADSQLERENPDFAALVEDYRRGLMIFDYNDKMIWSKAIYDSTGFADFYARTSVTKRLDNPSDSVYFWHERARIVVLDIADSSLITRAKVQKVLDKALKKKIGSSAMKENLDKAIGKNVDKKAVKVKVDLVERTRQQVLDEGQWQRGVYIAPRGNGYRAVVVEEVMPRTLKTQLEARGYYLNEYQNEVERNLNSSLREKYNVKIHRDVLKDVAF